MTQSKPNTVSNTPLSATPGGGVVELQNKPEKDGRGGSGNVWIDPKQTNRGAPIYSVSGNGIVHGLGPRQDAPSKIRNPLKTICLKEGLSLR